MKKILIVLLTLILVTILAASCTKQKETVAPEKLYSDIQKIQADMAYSSLKELYDPEPFEQLKAEAMAGKLDRIDCVFRLKKILSSYHVMHLNLVQQSSDPSAQMITPLYFYCFEDGYHVFFTIEKYKKYLGWKLKEMAGLSVEEACNKILEYYPYETPSGAKRQIERMLDYNQLKHAGLIDKTGRLKVVLESPDGKIKKLSIKKANGSKAKFVYLCPKKELYYHPYSLNANYGILACKEKRTLYIPYKSCYGIPEYPVTELFSDIKKELQTGLYDTIVFDIRYNGGGMPRETIMFRHLFYNDREDFQKCNLAVVTGGWTYSAACWFLNDFIDIFPEAVIFGEETGQAIFNYTDIYFSNVLKTLQCEFIFPQTVDTQNEYLIRRAAEVTHSDIHRGTMPDVEVHERFEDFMNGEDTIYNAVYDYFN